MLKRRLGATHNPHAPSFPPSPPRIIVQSLTTTQKGLDYLYRYPCVISDGRKQLLWKYPWATKVVLNENQTFMACENQTLNTKESKEQFSALSYPFCSAPRVCWFNMIFACFQNTEMEDGRVLGNTAHIFHEIAWDRRLCLIIPDGDDDTWMRK